MARKLIPVTTLVRNAGTAVPVAGTVDTSNGHYIAAGAVTGDFILWVDNTGLAGTVKILPGDNPPGLTAGSGTVEIAVPASVARYILVESSRVMQSDGQIHIDFATIAGSVAVYEVRPAGVA